VLFNSGFQSFKFDFFEHMDIVRNFRGIHIVALLLKCSKRQNLIFCFIMVSCYGSSKMHADGAAPADSKIVDGFKLWRYLPNFNFYFWPHLTKTERIFRFTGKSHILPVNLTIRSVFVKCGQK
jgi:hypothetical protein